MSDQKQDRDDQDEMDEDMLREESDAAEAAGAPEEDVEEMTFDVVIEQKAPDGTRIRTRPKTPSSGRWTGPSWYPADTPYSP